MKNRSNIGYAREPLQSSTLYDPDDHGQYNMNKLLWGIVLDVFPADARGNSSSETRQDFRGWRHEATVQVVNDGHGGVFRLDNVKIPSDSPTGVDNYEEMLPRPCTFNLSGGEFDRSLHSTNFEDLDGDWCVVGFIGGNIDEPVILSWFSNPNNKFDPQTSGSGNPDTAGSGTTLDQQGRYFRRINGVETTITPDGNVYFSTLLGGSTFRPESSPERGRGPRANPPLGGNCRFSFKENSILELDWTVPPNGLGIADLDEIFIPQTNPPPGGDQSSNPPDRDNTYWKISKSDIKASTDLTIKLASKVFTIESEEEVQIISPEVAIGQSDATINIQGSSVTLGQTSAAELVNVLSKELASSTLATAADTASAATGDLASLKTAVNNIGLWLKTLSITTQTKAS